MNLDVIFSPKSVAIIGASANPSKWGNWTAEQVIAHQHLRNVYLVNPRKEVIYGKQSLASIAEIPETIDIAIVTVPLTCFEKTVDELLIHGTKVIVGITTGFAERDQAGLELEQRVAKKIQEAGSIFVGPNCAGVLDNHSLFQCLPVLYPEKVLPAGDIGFISQSGGVIIDLYVRLEELGLNFSRVVSVGNLAGLSLSDLLKNFDEDPNTKVIALYIENDAAIDHQTFEETKKPIILMMPHHTPASVRAALKHTNSKLRGAAEEYVDNMKDLVATIQATRSEQSGDGERVMIVTDSGGLGILAAAEAEHNFLTVNVPSARLKRSLGIELQLLPQAVLSNPMDLIGIPNGFSTATIRAMRVLQHSPEVDAIIFILILTEEHHDSEYDVGIELARSARAGGKPVVFVCHRLTSPGVQALLKENMPVYRDIETAVHMVEYLCGL